MVTASAATVSASDATVEEEQQLMMQHDAQALDGDDHCDATVSGGRGQ